MVEFGEALAPPQAGLGRPRPHEMATRLSYLLWGSTPDDGADRSRRPGSPEDEGPDRRSRRAACSPIRRAHDVTRDFYTRLLRVGDLESRRSISIAMARSAAEETTRFVDHVVWTEGGNLDTLLAAPFTFADQTLAQLYGITGVTGAASSG